MPKSHTKSAGPLFSVSAWRGRTDRDPAEMQSGVGDLYHVVEEDMIIDGTKQSLPPTVENRAATGSKQLRPAPSPAAVEGWRVKKKRNISHDLQPASPNEHARQSMALPLDGAASGTDLAEAPLRLEGTAFLAALPDTSIAGHLVLSADVAGGTAGSASHGIAGKEVLAYRECTRDAEWSVVRLTLMDFALGREISLLVERTDGDAMRLRAPVEWQGMEAEQAAELESGCIAGAALYFDCEQLLADAAAESLLGKMQRSLCGRRAVVNAGAMLVELPAVAAKAVKSGNG